MYIVTTRVIFKKGDGSMEIPFSIVITTYNREFELRRCIQSILEQNYPNYEIIVVDDYSPKSYENEIKRDYPDIRFFSQKENRGPGLARNMGIKEANYNYVIIMDDDDIFTLNAFEKIEKFINTKIPIEHPVIHFLSSSGKFEEDLNFAEYSFRDYISGKVSGDTIHVINKEIFSIKGYFFPDSKIGSELLLWYQIAIDYGYLVVNEVVVKILTDSNNRLTNFNRQIVNAELFAQYQEEILKRFENDLLKIDRTDIIINKYRGAITYYLLSSNQTLAFKNLIKSIKYSKLQFLFFPLLLLPKSILIKLFLKYRG